MSTATDIADLKDRLAYCESMAANAVATRDITRQAVWNCQADRLRAEIRGLES